MKLLRREERAPSPRMKPAHREEKGDSSRMKLPHRGEKADSPRVNSTRCEERGPSPRMNPRRRGEHVLLLRHGLPRSHQSLPCCGKHMPRCEWSLSGRAQGPPRSHQRSISICDERRSSAQAFDNAEVK
jgi:hypothetical protein